jgi:nitrogen regulatory protein P-II 1
MKQLILIIHADLKRDVADLLHSIDIIEGFTLTSVEGHGPQPENDSLLSIRDKVVGYTPHVRIDLILEQEHIAPALAALRKSNIGLSENSIYWIMDIEEYGRL